MLAKEMFNNLGYEQIIWEDKDHPNQDGIRYIKRTSSSKYVDETEYIDFFTRTNKLMTFIENKHTLFNKEWYDGVTFDIDLINAINKQIDELGWLPNSSDYYLDDNNSVNRLLYEWKTYGKLVIAVDFDDTLFDFHKKGRTYNDVINLLKACREIGCYIVVFTANDDIEHHAFIKSYLRDAGLEIDTINENIECVGFTTKKVYYNILLDDRSGLSSAYNNLNIVADYMKIFNTGVDNHNEQNKK